METEEKKPLTKKRRLLRAFEKTALKVGSLYLEIGGPTTRLEEKIMRLGLAYNIKAEVFATPSALIVSAFDSQERLTTSLNRIKEKDIDLNALAKLDFVLEQMIEKTISFEEGYAKVADEKFLDPIYNTTLVLLCSFAVGFLISILEFSNLTAAFFSGTLSLILVSLVQPLMNILVFTRIFYVFFGSLFCISIATITAMVFNLPVESIFIGSLVNMVPGLMLTTAVSELAEHNFVSGTVKLVKGVLVLLSIGTALFIGIDAMDLLGYQNSPLDLSLKNSATTGLWTNMLATFSIVIAFSIRFQTPAKYILFSSISGLLGWLTIYSIGNEVNYVFPTFMASLVVGSTSLLFARLLKSPSQIFSVPGIISMVPGVLSASLYNYSEIGVQAASTPTDTPILKVSLITSSIVFGLISSRFPFRIYKKVTGDMLIPSD